MELETDPGRQKPRPILAFLGILWVAFGIILFIVQIALPARIEIRWETETEFNTAGFNIFRSEIFAGPYEQLNDSLIPTTGDAASGGDYSFLDRNVSRGKTYFYRLEDVDFGNTTSQQEPIAAKATSISGLVFGLAVAAIAIGIIMLISYRIKTKTDE